MNLDQIMGAVILVMAGWINSKGKLETTICVNNLWCTNQFADMMSPPRFDWPSRNSTQLSFTQVNPIYNDILGIQYWKTFCKDCLGITNNDKKVSKKFQKRDADRVTINLDDNGISIWPDEDPDDKWSLLLHKAMIREYLKAYYSEYNCIWAWIIILTIDLQWGLVENQKLKCPGCHSAEYSTSLLILILNTVQKMLPWLIHPVWHV